MPAASRTGRRGRTFTRPMLQVMLFALTLLLSATSSTRAQAPTKVEVETRRDLVYATHDGQRLLAEWYGPSASESYPALIAIHGGGWQAGDKIGYRHWGPEKVGSVRLVQGLPEGSRDRVSSSVEQHRSAMRLTSFAAGPTTLKSRLKATTPQPDCSGPESVTRCHGSDRLHSCNGDLQGPHLRGRVRRLTAKAGPTAATRMMHWCVAPGGERAHLYFARAVRRLV